MVAAGLLVLGTHGRSARADVPDQTDDAVGAEGTALEVHGFVSQGFIKSTGNNYLADSKRGSFEFTEVGLNFTKAVTDRLRLGVQLFARDLGPVGDYAAKMDWFYLDYRLANWLGLRAGRTKLPFGLYNEINDVDAARVPILLPQAVYPINNRDLLLAQTGLELYGYVPLGAAGTLDYRLYGGTIYIPTPAPPPGTVITNFGVPYIVGGRLLWETPIDGLRTGVSAQVLRLDTAYGLPTGVPVLDLRFLFHLWVASIEFARDDLLLAAEYGRWRANIDSDTPTFESVTQTNERFYAMGSYRIAPWFTPGAYYAGFYPKVDDRHGRDAYLHDIAATLRFDLGPAWILKLEGHFLRGTAELDPKLNENKTPAMMEKDWALFLAKTTVYF
jgi:hypothetical protein